MNSSSPTETRAALIITAAGKSVRMNAGEKKEYRSLDGTPVLLKIYQIFSATNRFFSIVITCPAGDIPRVSNILQLSGDHPEVILLEGGETRQDSVFAGLKALEALKPEIVLIHDGSRPWISEELILGVLQQTIEHGGCIPAAPPIDTLITLGMDNTVAEYIDRAQVARVQTPQGFHYPCLLSAHRKAKDDGKTYTDDSEIYTRYCGPVHVTRGNPANRKITYPWDI